MVTLIKGNDGSNTLNGGSGDDVIYGFDPDGPQSIATKISAVRVAASLDQPLFVAAPVGDLNPPVHRRENGARQNPQSRFWPPLGHSIPGRVGTDSD